MLAKRFAKLGMNLLRITWALQCVAPSTGTMQGLKGEYEGKPCVVVTSDPRSGTSWHVNLQQTGLALEQAAVYELSFAAKAEVPVQLSASFPNSSQRDAPWSCRIRAS